MKKDTNLIVRVNGDVKDKVQQIANDSGFSLSSIISYYLSEVVRRGKIPFSSLYRNRAIHNYSIDLELFINMLRVAVLNSEVAPQIKEVYLFGSYSRNEQNKNSDIDLRVEFDEGTTMLDVSSFRIDMEDMLKKEIHVLSTNSDDPFLEEIKNDEILVYKRK